MQLYQLTLIMAALAAGLVAVLVLAWRSLRKPSQPRAPRERPRLQVPSAKLSRREEPTEPAEPEPAYERRRKLHPVSLTEESSAAQANAILFSEDVFSKLEQAFEAYQRESISLETYSSLVMAEQQAVERRILELRADIAGNEPSEPQASDLADAETAREAVRWCIDWAYERARGQQAATG